MLCLFIKALMEPLPGFRINLAAGWRSEPLSDAAAAALGEPFSRPASLGRAAERCGEKKRLRAAELRVKAEWRMLDLENIGLLPYFSCIQFLNIA